MLFIAPLRIDYLALIDVFPTAVDVGVFLSFL